MDNPYAALDEHSVADILRSLRVRTALYCRSEFRSRWGFGVPGRDVAAFHVVTVG